MTIQTTNDQYEIFYHCELWSKYHTPYKWLWIADFSLNTIFTSLGISFLIHILILFFIIINTISFCRQMSLKGLSLSHIYYMLTFLVYIIPEEYILWRKTKNHYEIFTNNLYLIEHYLLLIDPEYLIYSPSITCDLHSSSLIYNVISDSSSLIPDVISDSSSLIPVSVYHSKQ